MTNLIGTKKWDKQKWDQQMGQAKVGPQNCCASCGWRHLRQRVIPHCPLVRRLLGRFCFHFIYGGSCGLQRTFLWTSNLKLSTSESLKMTTKASLSNWILWRSLNNSIFGPSPHLAWRVAFSTIVLPISHMSPPGQAGRRRDVRRSTSTGVCRLGGTASQTRTCSRRCSCLALAA